MPSAEYFRRQADICLRLSLIASDDEVSGRLISMAREYMIKGDSLARERPADMPRFAHLMASEDVDRAGEGPASGGPTDP